MTQEEKLYQLLPSWHRKLDAETSEALRGFMGILDEVRKVLHDDIGNLHDNWFIETCDEWVISYIADLLGVNINHSISSAGMFSQRPFVGRTIHYRRRKGTVSVLENIAKDVSGWPVKAVEFFQHMGWTQHLNHIRMDHAQNPFSHGSGRFNPTSQFRVGSVNIRDIDACDRITGPFNMVSHTFDMRPLNQLNGHFGIEKIGLFTWRLAAHTIRKMKPRQSQTYADGYSFDPAGIPRQLFTNPRVQANNDAPQDEQSVPARVRCTAFWMDKASYYGTGPDASCAVYDNHTLIPVEQVIIKDLSSWDPPSAGKVAIDPSLGRFAFAPGQSPETVHADFTHGFGVDIGGGPYDRRDSLIRSIAADYAVTIAKDGSADHTSINSALSGWNQTTHKRAVITIHDNETYAENLVLTLEQNVRLVIQSSNTCRPHIQCLNDVSGPGVIEFSGSTGSNSAAEFDGLFIEGAFLVNPESVRDLNLRHCTLIPGRAIGEDGSASFASEPSITFELDSTEHLATFYRSITGPVIMEENSGKLCAAESIIDHPDGGAAVAGLPNGTLPGPDLELDTCTITGEVNARRILLATGALFKKRVLVQRKQDGCMRYCYIDERVSKTPRRFRCQPEYIILEKGKRPAGLSVQQEVLIRNRTIPVFTSSQYGKSGYCQLALPVGRALGHGNEDRNEIGVFNILKQAFRTQNIEQRTHEYAPVQMEPGIIQVT